MQGDYFFLPLEHVIFGAGSLERLPGELERLKVRRALIITGQSLATKTGIVRKVEETLGAAHVGTFSSIRQHTPGKRCRQGSRRSPPRADLSPSGSRVAGGRRTRAGGTA
jgi:alcohol dehydrogenase class IV